MTEIKAVDFAKELSKTAITYSHQMPSPKYGYT
jgi:hypothetical protein